MSESDIINKWLRVGYSKKREERKTKSGRRKTGEKGVGRISADRLGSLLQLRTQKKGHSAQGVEIHWEQFERHGVDIGDVPIKRLSDTAFSVPPKRYGDDGLSASRSRPGTELLVRELRDNWRTGEVLELRNTLSSLTPPFGEVVDFEVRVTSDVASDEDGPIESPFLETAEVEGRFALESNGRVTCTFVERGKSGNRLEPKVEKYPWSQFVHSMRNSASDSPSFGRAEAVFLFYPRSRETMRGTDLRLGELKDFLNQNAGVKVYRDLVRVLPYGDPFKPEGDWLALGDRKARDPAGAGRPSFKVAPNQIVGAVFLTRDGNPEIADTSSREGLVSGAPLDQLKEFLIGCLIALEARYHKIFVARQFREKASEPPKQVVELLRSDLSGLSDELRRVESSLSDKDADVVDELLERIAGTRERISKAGRSLEDLASHATIYRGLATLGIAAATFGHETLADIQQVRMSIKDAIADLELDEPDFEEVLQSLGDGLKSSGSISAWGQFTLGRVRRDKRRKKKEDLKDLTAKLLDEMKVPFEAAGIALRRSLAPVSVRVFPMDIEAILINLLSNAFFFIKTTRRERVIMTILKPKVHDSVPGFQLVIADSGPGVPVKRREVIWDPLYSTKVDSSKREVGTGLGLAIVDATVEELGGWRAVDEAPTLKGARFTVWLPAK